MTSRRHRVAAFATEPQSPFELSCAIEVFGINRPGLPSPYDFRVCASSESVASAITGLSFHVEGTLDDLSNADTVIIAGWPPLDAAIPADTADAVLRAHRRGARVIGLCYGAFLLAGLGLLDGKRATTHWRATRRFAAAYPRVQLDTTALFIQSGSLATSAGTGAALDLCLEIARQDHGAAYALAISRHMVMPPRRDGGQRQYAQPVAPASPAPSLAGLLDWAHESMQKPIGVRDMAAWLNVSTRTLARYFETELGLGPGQWLLSQRVNRARILLETTDLSVDAVAQRAGLSSASNLRRRFHDQLGTTPGSYRRTFGAGTALSGDHLSD